MSKIWITNRSLITVVLKFYFFNNYRKLSKSGRSGDLHRSVFSLIYSIPLNVGTRKLSIYETMLDKKINLENVQ